MMKKIFILMRHAKSDWYAGNLSDFNRPLNARGRDASDLVGEYLQSINYIPDEILHSSAKRTTETTERVMQAARWYDNQAITVKKSDSIYLCSVNKLLEEISQTRRKVNTLLVINHQPTCAELIYQLCGKWVEMKTASFTVIECEIDDWSLLEIGDKQFVQHVCPTDIDKK